MQSSAYASKMRYAAAYLLALLGGNKSPDIAAIEKILGSVGIECDKTRAQQVIDACQGRNVEDIIADGMIKIGDGMTHGTATTIEPIPSKEPLMEVEQPAETPPGSPGDDPTFVSSCLDWIILMNLFSFSSVYSIEIVLFNFEKSYSKQDMSSILLSLVFYLVCIIQNKISINFVIDLFQIPSKKCLSFLCVN